MRLLRATETDSARLNEFFSKVPLKGSFDYHMHRQGSFFDHYRIQSDDFETLCLVDAKDKIQGMVTLVFHRGLINQEKTSWCFATDLRISISREAITNWTQLFVPAIERACSERNCRFLFSAVEHSRNQAYNALIRPNSHARRRLPRYYLVNKLHVVSLLGRWPFAARPLESIRLQSLELSDLEAACQFMRSKANLRPLANAYEPDEFIAMLDRWPGLALSDFRLAKDVRGNILGLAGLWSKYRTQDVIPQRYHGFAQTFQQSLNVGSWLGLSRALAPPHQPMQTRMLTNVFCENAEVFHSLVDDAFSRLGSREFLTYGHFRGHWRTLPPRSFISASVPFGFYLILPPTGEPPPWMLLDPHRLPPEFEVAWL